MNEILSFLLFVFIVFLLICFAVLAFLYSRFGWIFKVYKTLRDAPDGQSHRKTKTAKKNVKMTVYDTRDQSQRSQKIFSKDEGTYVDFEEQP